MTDPRPTPSPTLARLQAEYPKAFYFNHGVFKSNPRVKSGGIVRVLAEAITALDAEVASLKAQLAEVEIVLADIAKLVEDDPSAKARIITSTVQAILKENPDAHS